MLDLNFTFSVIFLFIMLFSINLQSTKDFRSFPIFLVLHGEGIYTSVHCLVFSCY